MPTPSREPSHPREPSPSTFPISKNGTPAAAASLSASASSSSYVSLSGLTGRSQAPLFRRRLRLARAEAVRREENVERVERGEERGDTVPARDLASEGWRMWW